MKLIGFLLVLFVGMSGVSYGQHDIEKIETQFKDAVDNQNDSLIILFGSILFDHYESSNILFDRIKTTRMFDLCRSLRNKDAYDESILKLHYIQKQIIFRFCFT